ncbi:hypothetical protein [Rubritepida flocculans]|uniref:hypothetical protein n=1 Tax=Rubritepida flocculans TaxID=182403 RepID=UPI00040D0AEB|nr:hypothetical protein [Rubritepida flocculans]
MARIVLAALAGLPLACAAPAPPPPAAPAPAPGSVTRSAAPAPVPGVAARQVQPAKGPGVTHRESLLPDSGALGNAGLDGALPDLARPGLPRR